MFQRLLREETIFVRLDAPNREAALAEMVALLPSWSLTPRQKSEVLDLLLQRERFGTTAVGEGVALPRCTMAALETPIIALGIHPRGVQYPSLDGEPVHLVLVSIFPESTVSDYDRQRVLHSAELILKDRFLKERLKLCQTPEEALEVIMRESNILLETLPLAGNQ